jgi:putative ABC transport system permease protein
MAEAILLAVLGGVVGVGLGALSTAVYAATKGWTIVVPPVAWAGGFGAPLAIGSCRPPTGPARRSAFTDRTLRTA